MTNESEDDSVEWLSDLYHRRSLEDQGPVDDIHADSTRMLLMRLDPESETHFDFLAAIIAEEIEARRAIAPEEFDSVEGIRAVAELIADGVLDGFQVRRRTVEMPRYEWHESEGGDSS